MHILTFHNSVQIQTQRCPSRPGPALRMWHTTNDKIQIKWPVGYLTLERKPPHPHSPNKTDKINDRHWKHNMSCASHHHGWISIANKRKKPLGSFSLRLGCVRPTRKQGNCSGFILFVIVVIFSIKVSQSALSVWGLFPVSGGPVLRVPGSSVVPGSSFLHAGRFGFGDVLVVGLVLQFPAEVLDGFIQAFFQWHLQTHKHAHDEAGARSHCPAMEPRLLPGGREESLGPEEPIKKNLIRWRDRASKLSSGLSYILFSLLECTILYFVYRG